MNAWNQWGGAAYPTAIPAYGAPQAATTAGLPSAAALPPVAAAAVPYPAMPGFQAWPYTATPQAMAPWGTPAPTGQTAQWEQWNQWHQQYSQWQQQQHYATQTPTTTPHTAQSHTTVSTAKVNINVYI